MNITRLYFFIFLSLVLTTSCKRNVTEGHGKIVSENRAVGSFSAIEINAPIDAIITVGGATQTSVSLKGYANLLEKIKTNVENGTLVISKDNVINFYSDEDMIATITLPSINSLSIRGASDADIKGIVSGDKFVLKVSGAGDVSIEKLNVNNFESSLSGAGDLKVEAGVANIASFMVRGAGDISAYALACKKVDANVSGAGDIKVNVSEELNAKISGAGSINYKGHPKNVSSNIKGFGEVEEVN